ncbi:uncharacterized protein DUF4031 [Kineococcus xinjiangensis]|uniref:Uncharacterized protein DUF4031 n=1 Tax=Kineococcus xinjiangensis TaxID=512762 RepID=A0A2S6ITA4_9ACTN|nr:DUF4031 domain-containing protein [Kineococcus xinjiangensis]PPK97410.1 uncharacterized protein DUF4031 [Kineococcus xinjiangensis]
MTLLIDPPAWHAHGRQWSHLASDDSYAELHAFAARLGVPRRAFEGDHYDVPADLHARAVAAGARAVSTRELLTRLRAAGLRRPKRRGEKVVSSRDAGDLRIDVVLSARLPHPHGSRHLVQLDAPGRRLRTVPTPSGADLPVAAPGDPHEDAHGEVLGFRRTWRLQGGRRVLVHDGLLRVDLAPAAGAAWTPFGDLPPRWWSPLLVAAGILPPAGGTGP